MKTRMFRFAILVTVLACAAVSLGAERDAVVKITGTDSKRHPYQGSGVCVDPSGIILTVYHVVARTTKESRRVFFGEKAYRVTDSWIPVSEDVAVLKINGKNLPYLKVAISEPEVGDKVWGMGFRAGKWNTNGGEIVTKTVSFYRRGPYTLLGTSVPVDGGQSGGPLVDSKWDVVGILSVMNKRPAFGMMRIDVYAANTNWKSGYLNLVRIRVAMAQLTSADKQVPVKQVLYAFTPGGI